MPSDQQLCGWKYLAYVKVQTGRLVHDIRNVTVIQMHICCNQDMENTLNVQHVEP